nr:hypothetical protein [Tanacetum cinerariifolium]
SGNSTVKEKDDSYASKFGNGAMVVLEEDDGYASRRLMLKERDNTGGGFNIK